MAKKKAKTEVKKDGDDNSGLRKGAGPETGKEAVKEPEIPVPSSDTETSEPEKGTGPSESKESKEGLISETLPLTNSTIDPLLRHADGSQVEKLGKGQIYFEAPDGTLKIGEATQQRLWYRAGNGGQGMWINPKR